MNNFLYSLSQKGMNFIGSLHISYSSIQFIETFGQYFFGTIFASLLVYIFIRYKKIPNEGIYEEYYVNGIKYVIYNKEIKEAFKFYWDIVSVIFYFAFVYNMIYHLNFNPLDAFLLIGKIVIYPVILFIHIWNNFYLPSMKLTWGFFIIFLLSVLSGFAFVVILLFLIFKFLGKRFSIRI